MPPEEQEQSVPEAAPETVSEPIASDPIPVSEPEPIAPIVETAPVITPVAVSPSRSTQETLLMARAKIQDKKQKRLEKIMALVSTRNKISNDDVEKLLHVSDATATRYLDTLKKQGRIQQVGRTGKAVFYTKV